MNSIPYKITRTTHRGRPAELLTFIGSTTDEYDQFLDARFADGREPLGWRTDAGAKGGNVDGRFVWFQFRREIAA